MVQNSKVKIIAIGIALLLVLGVVLGLVFGLRGKASSPYGELSGTPFVNAYKSATMAGVSSQVVNNNVQRVKPVEGVHDGGLATGYPKYGKTLNLTSEQKNAILKENKSFCGKPTTNKGGVYDFMDENGYLYTGTRANPTQLFEADSVTPRQLYKHTASIGLYGGNVSDSEPAVSKKFYFRPRSYTSYYDVTGMYAPAGELIKIELSGADMDATGGISIHIGQALYNGQANDIWEARAFNRMPIILNTMHVTKSTAVYNEATDTWTGYVGNFFGGPIYVRDERVNFSVTISGGVNYPHFILGVTTPEEYAQLQKSSAPFFDLEVWQSGVLHSGPYSQAKGFTYEQLYNAAVLWEKISLVSTRVKDQGIVFIYDPFVAAGAAVAFPGRRSVNCPTGWMKGALNYEAFVNSGSWGNMHEYHHNFQNFGVGYTGEVTNNALNLVSYSLFTKISSARQIGSYGCAGLSGWNRYTSATWALNQVNNGSIGSTNGLAVYATLLHNFGQDAFIKSTGATGKNYFDKWARNTHQDFTYYASQITAYTGSAIVPSTTEYPTFVPVSSVYQTGRSYMYDTEKRYIETMQPYVIPFGQAIDVDLTPYKVNSAGQYERGSVIIGKGFSYKIKSVNTSELNGKFEQIGSDGVYRFTPNGELKSGKIYVTLEIINNADGTNYHNGKKLDDVDLVLEFLQTHEKKKATLEKTVYTYEDGKGYTDARTAYEKEYAGYTSAETVDNKNYSQNSNTDVWLYADTDAFKNNAAYAPYVVNNNQIYEIKGKLYFPEEGKYRIYMRGRISCALYISRDEGKTYTPAAYIQEESPAKNSAQFRTADENTYVDVEVEPETWIYFKEVLVTKRIGTTNSCSYVGLGLGTWTVPLYSTEMKYYDKDGNQVSEGSEDIVRTEVIYKNAAGKVVTEEEAANTDPIAPTSASYVTAYRQEYEFTKQFASDYFYKKEWNYNYVGDPEIVTQGKTITPTADCNYAPWFAEQKWENLFDNDLDTAIHFSKKWGVSANNPAVLAYDLGEKVTANSIRLYVNKTATGNDKGFPRNFTLEGSLDGETYFEMGKWTGVGQPSVSTELTFNDGKSFDFRYFRLSVTATTNGRVGLSELEFAHTVRLTGNGNNYFLPDNDMFSYAGDWSLVQTNASSGKVYLGKKNAQMKFEFTGAWFAVLSSYRYGQNFEVYVDGKKLDSTDFKKGSGDYGISYLSPELSDGKHTVVIKCTGETTIDSVATYQKAGNMAK